MAGWPPDASVQISRIPPLRSLQITEWQLQHRQFLDIRPQAGVLHVNSHLSALGVKVKHAAASDFVRIHRRPIR
jgi:hypothetical protein